MTCRPSADGVGPGGAEFASLIEALRRVLDAASLSAPSSQDARRAVAHLNQASDLLAGWRQDQSERITGRRDDLPGRGNPLLPAFRVFRFSNVEVRARVTFTEAFLGRGSVHGGVLPLLFDDVLGHLANVERAHSRTAFLHVDYRALTPIGQEVTLQADVDRIEGRKRFLSGRLLDGEKTLVEARGLFVELKPEHQASWAAGLG